MRLFGRLNIDIIDPLLFRRKVAIVFMATLVLVPLVYFKWYVPAACYLVTLLTIHVLFLGVYLAKVPWRQLAENQFGLVVRILAVGLFVYLLSILRFHGDWQMVITNLALGLIIHTLILLGLMADIRIVADVPN